MKLYLVDNNVKSIDIKDISTVDILTNKKFNNDFEVLVNDGNNSYRFYSILYKPSYSKKECISLLKSSLIENFNIPENKIRVIK